jgi:hypothetical protein
VLPPELKLRPEEWLPLLLKGTPGLGLPGDGIRLL